MPLGPGKYDDLLIWAVYDHPKDFPDVFVARLWHGARRPREPQPTAEIITDPDLGRLREELSRRGCSKHYRHPGDDPVILETWS